jgi:hypothetical protein
MTASIVGTPSFAEQATTAQVLSLSQAVPSGDSLVVVVRIYTGNSVVSVVTNQSDTLTLAQNHGVPGSEGLSFATYAAHNITSGANSVTITQTNFETLGAGAVIVSGLSGSVGNTAGYATSNSTSASRSITTSDGSFVIGPLKTNSGVTRTGTGGTTAEPSTSAFDGMAYKIVGAGSESMDVTLSGSVSWWLAAVEFLAAPSGATPPFTSVTVAG